MFTVDDDGGNPLGVVPDTTGLSTGSMQAVAADLGFSETIFVDWREGGHPRVRIFTPAAELAFAGHPLVGAGWLLNELGPGATGLVCGVGAVRVRARPAGAWISVPSYHRPLEQIPDAFDLAGRSGLPEPIRAVRVRLPAPYLLLEVASEGDVAKAAPDLRALAALEDVEGVYVYCRAGRVRARFFAPSLGVDEDPATGSAAVALATVLNSLGERSGRLEIRQGEEIGRPSLIRLRWEGDDTEIGGRVILDEVRVLEV